MLRQTVATILGLALSGIPYAGPDIGGFNGAPSAELFLRWFQLAALLPFFRTHAALGTPRREPWSFDPATLAAIRELLRLRLRLMPYLYTLAWQAHQTGWPLVRPLFWPDGAEPDLWDVDDAFLLGDALLVAPVLEQGARVRGLTLPRGRWYSLWGDAVLDGPGYVHLQAPLDRVPILVRAGTVLPLDEAGQLVLHLFPPAEGMGEGLVYSDAGDGEGDWRVDRFRLVRQGARLIMTWESEGTYPLPYAAPALQIHGLRLRAASLDGVPVEPHGSRLQIAPGQQLMVEEISGT